MTDEAKKKLYSSAKISPLPDSEVEVLVTVPAENLVPYRARALSHLMEEAALPGFRKGKVPEKMVLEKIGPMGVLEEAAELLIKDTYADVIIDNKLDVLGMPSISIEKLAPDNDLEFKIRASLFPTFELPDYKKIGKTVSSQKTDSSISEKEIEDVIEEIRKIRATKKEDGTSELPELTDDFVKTIGEFTSVEDFKTKVKENLGKEKEFRNKEKTRLELINKIIEKSDIPVPAILLESELDRMIAQMTDDMRRRGTTVSEYLAQIKKTEDDLRKDWREDAKTRVKFELVLEKIATLENITAPKEELDKEVDHILEHYEGAVPERVRTYVEHQLRNEEVFKFLENQK
jgi:FKBP-type peptidyl-prolyl cis-trans isomerase (trigger factor)